MKYNRMLIYWKSSWSSLAHQLELEIRRVDISDANRMSNASIFMSEHEWSIISIHGNPGRLWRYMQNSRTKNHPQDKKRSH